MKLKDYPKEIQEFVMNKILEMQLIDAFLWDETEEGFDFWDQIDDGNLQPFYDKYPVPDTREKK